MITGMTKHFMFHVIIIISINNIIIISIFVVNNFKVNLSARCVSAAISAVICKEIDIFNKNKITLVDIS
jgi:hypothetical protein